LTLISIAGIYLGFYIFGMLGRGTGHDILAVVILISIVVLPTIIWKKQTKTRHSSTLKK
jgi:phosphoglycerol transferase MdoB-like AlkP superfamily enzyme